MGSLSGARGPGGILMGWLPARRPRFTGSESVCVKTCNDPDEPWLGRPRLVDA